MPYRTQAMVWRNIEETLRQVPCTCIDGRSSGVRYSVAGGSLGLIIPVLAVIQAQNSKNFTAGTVAPYLDQFADAVGPVYMHTDQHTVNTVFARLGLAPDTQLANLTMPQQRSFRELATQPEHQGCGHLKLMMASAADYGVPVQLMAAVLTAFFDRYFTGHDGYRFEVLPGEHAEVAAVILDNLEPINLAGEVPLYAKDGASSHFFCHRPLKQVLIERYLSALAASSLPNLPLNEAPMLVRTHNRAAELTLEQLAPDLPIEHLGLPAPEDNLKPGTKGATNHNDSDNTGATV